jgi:Asp-tRNA(Asn)/Glu-tRNA(Gln) amidotransferase A subunit family amidase
VATFGLVHGAWHGAWCWEQVVARLEALGQEAVAVDLPAEEPDAGAEAYAQVVLGALADHSDIVLVGHSWAGLTLPVVAASRPVRRMVFLAPLLPKPGYSFDELLAAEPDMLMPGLGAGQEVLADGSTRWQPAAAVATMYPDAPPALAEAAARRLRLQAWRITHETTPLTTWPAGEVQVIAGANDAVVNADWVRRAARVRFGVEAHLLPGDHAPFLSRPEELADLLVSSLVDVPPVKRVNR